jgi:hypothetical protein
VFTNAANCSWFENVPLSPGRRGNGMRKAIIALSISGFLLTILYLMETLRYPIGTAAEPGPGAYPLLITAVLMLGFIGSGLEALYSTAQGAVQWPIGPARRRMLIIAGTVFAYALLLPVIGHAISGTLLAFTVLQAMNKKAWVANIFMSLCFGVGSYFLFVGLLDLPLPTGSIFG